MFFQRCCHYLQRLPKGQQNYLRYLYFIGSTRMFTNSPINVGNNIDVYLHPLPLWGLPLPGGECWRLCRACSFGETDCTVPLRGGRAQCAEGVGLITRWGNCYIISKYYRDNVILTERNGGRILRKSQAESTARFFAALKMTRDVFVQHLYYFLTFYPITRTTLLYFW